MLRTLAVGLAAALVAALVAGCASLPREVARVPSQAITDPETTWLGREIGRGAAQRPGQSGFMLLPYGHQAFTARIALADLAQKTIDVQYYIWEADATGRVLVERLARAAERGVRVRVLIDDANQPHRDRVIASFDAHPNIEVRVFNPFVQRDAKAFEFLADFRRVNHRMHNKLMVIDNAVAIVGGRNMSDPYFSVDPEHNFRDLDVVAVGPVVPDLSGVFDRFWNGEWAVPIAALAGEAHSIDDYRSALRLLRDAIVANPYPWPLRRDIAELESEIETLYGSFVWGSARVLADDPASIRDPTRHMMSSDLARRLAEVERELLLESAYLVPTEWGTALVERLRVRGVRIRALTNSLASNDVVAAFAGYSKYRERLVAAGVELHELRPDAGPIRRRMFLGIRGGSRAGLHTKAMVFDRREVFIGSFNLDPRSSFINTEAGLLISSPELAAQLAAYMDEGTRPDNAYRVRIGAEGRLHWVHVEAGDEVRHDVDPLSTPLQRLQAWWIRMLPLEDQL